MMRGAWWVIKIHVLCAGDVSFGGRAHIYTHKHTHIGRREKSRGREAVDSCNESSELKGQKSFPHAGRGAWRLALLKAVKYKSQGGGGLEVCVDCY